MRDAMESLEAEYARYRRLGDGTLEQMDHERLLRRPSPESNSIAMIVWHVAGNLESRFTDFLTTDGEKASRDREDEFAIRDATADEVLEKWARGWSVLEATLADLTDDDLSRTITIRGVELGVAHALQRSLAHTAYHVGQMTYLGKLFAGSAWTYLSIAPGGTDAYNRNPTRERG